jgi:glucosamine--fructose-6-phosphate aminotransferase (isomerizing)
MGASLNAAIPLENLLSVHGIESCSVEAGEFLHYRLSAYPDATIAVVSRSGESVEVAKLIAALRGRQPIIGVTNETNSTLAREADVVLDVGSLPDEMVAIQSYTGALLTLYLLGMIAVGKWDAGRRELDAVLSDLPGWIAANLEASRQWDEFLGGNSAVYLLGRGPSYGSAAQGALLFNEIAKAPAIGMGVASFRHGPIEVVDRHFRGLIFVPCGKTRGLNLSLAEDINRFSSLAQADAYLINRLQEYLWARDPSARLLAVTHAYSGQIAGFEATALTERKNTSTRFEQPLQSYW